MWVGAGQATLAKVDLLVHLEQASGWVKPRGWVVGHQKRSGWLGGKVTPPPAGSPSKGEGNKWVELLPQTVVATHQNKLPQHEHPRGWA